MDIQLIECNLIDVPKSNQYRTFKKDFAISLADSIRVEGMYNAIVVRPSTACPGRYILVQGKHRLYAKRNVLKEQFIESNVLTDLDDEDAEMATIAENLWRNPISAAQSALCIRRWHEHYTRKYPDRVGPQAGGQANADKHAQRREETGNGQAVSDTAEATEETQSEESAKAPEGGFTATASAATGMSERTVARLKKIGTSFGEEELGVFDRMKTSQTDILTIAKIKDEANRGAVLRLVASGMAAQEAIKEVMKENAPSKAGALGAEAQAGKDKASATVSPDLTDEQWYETYCAAKGQYFAHSSRFKRDAILYRHFVEPRHNFRLKMKKRVKAEIARSDDRPPMANLLNRVLAMAHPKDWLICDQCSGTGQQHGQKCLGCYGGGYRLKLEEYL